MSKLEIPESWALAISGEVFDVRDGTHDSPKQKATGVPLVTSKNLKNGEIDFSTATFISESDFIEISKRSGVDPGDILMPMIGTLGNPVIVNCSTKFAIKNVALFKPKLKETSLHFLKYYLQSPFFIDVIEENKKGATQQFLSLKVLRGFKVPIPPVNEQCRIVAKIESTQEKIKTIEQNVTKAEELIGKYREALLQKAFRGELVPQDPNHEPASMLLKRIRADRAKQTDGKKRKKDDLPSIRPEEIPFEIPESWEWVRLGDVASEPLSNGAFKKRHDFGAGAPFLNVGDVFPSLFADPSQFERVKVTKDDLKKHELKKGDLVFVRSSLKKEGIAKPCLFNTEQSGVIFDCHLIRLRPNQAMISPLFLLLVTDSDFFRSAAIKAGNMSTMTTISQPELSKLLIPLPPLKQQGAIAEAVLKNINNAENFRPQLFELKKMANRALSAILASAFTGRLVPQDPSEGTGQELLEKLKEQTFIPGGTMKSSKKRAKS